MTYYDPAPLLEAAERAVLRCERHPMSVAASPDAATANELAGVLGVANRTVVRWRNGGQVPGRMVDDLATRIGYHPASLWPDWVDEALVPCIRWPESGRDYHPLPPGVTTGPGVPLRAPRSSPTTNRST